MDWAHLQRPKDDVHALCMLFFLSSSVTSLMAYLHFQLWLASVIFWSAKLHWDVSFSTLQTAPSSSRFFFNMMCPIVDPGVGSLKADCSEAKESWRRCMSVGFQSEKKEQPLTNLLSCVDLHVDVRHSTGGSDAQMMLQMVQIDRYCRDTPTVPPAPVTSPLPPLVEFLQSLAGLVRLCPAPCRCYGLEHSTSAKWGNWSQLDLWLLDPPQLNRAPPPPPSSFLSLMPTFSLPLLIITPPPPSHPSTLCSHYY